MTQDSLIRSQSGRMSPAAPALALGMHVLIAMALWWISPLRPYDHSETPIMITVEPEPLSGAGDAAASSSDTFETAATTEFPSAEPAQQATATESMIPPAESTQRIPSLAEPALPPDMSRVTETPPLEEAKTDGVAEAAWQTDALSWKPHVTFEQPPPPAETLPMPASSDVLKPPRIQPTRPAQRAQTAFPPWSAQPHPQPPPGDSQATASVSGPKNSPSQLAGHGGERNDYLSRVFRHIEPFRNYPDTARANRQRGRVVTRVTINRAGELVAIAVDRSSGWPLIDNAEIAAIRRAMPLPPPPAGMPGDPIVLVLPMTYNYESR